MKWVLLGMLVAAVGCEPQKEPPHECEDRVVLISPAAGTPSMMGCPITSTVEVHPQQSGALVICRCPRPGTFAAEPSQPAEQPEEQPK